MRALFRKGRAKDLEQYVHRIRPLTAEETKHIYLLTNIPTTLPVDDVVDLDDFSNEPFHSHLPLPSDAIPHLLEPLKEILTSEIPTRIDNIEVFDDSVTAIISGFMNSRT